MDPMSPLPKKGDFLQGLIVTMCCSHKLLKFCTLPEGDKPFLGYTNLSCFLLFGVEAGVI